MTEEVKKLSVVATILIMIVSTTVSVTLAISGPDAQLRGDISLIKKDIDTIIDNHLPHITSELENINNTNDEQDTYINQTRIDIARILAILEGRIQ